MALFNEHCRAANSPAKKQILFELNTRIGEIIPDEVNKTVTESLESIYRIINKNYKVVEKEEDDLVLLMLGKIKISKKKIDKNKL